ncbi:MULTISPECIES: DUF421 domain-containing protein [Allobacillus]|uniref:DUF421 domain-containing protein n=1 Tax=Allobacillus halotolerans TaxID=570278 RepID=A0ABS6GML5_9BACI|nr:MULTISPECIES: YetF domain-containing protein [Allobacillus]MBU6079884.1 DUF421 domain-containing protein [Allobacillus halotolerans]TSJ67881.1 DUF421 domain-containing protein [Allobacillus sp. SKP2-8]
MFFNGWEPLIRILILGISSYFFLIFFLRISGKRTLSKMNMFDLIITVALGSTFATIILNSKISLSEGIVALGLLTFLQYLVAWLSVRSKTFRNLIKSTPVLLFYEGRYKTDAMKVNRVHRSEILQSVREQGIGSLDQVKAVVMETNGSLSIIKKANNDDENALQNVTELDGK